MSQLTKAESSRINGAKSRGPVTPEGKQRSAKNAVRHGLLAKNICLNIEKTEVFEELLNDFIGRIQPTGPIEMRLVEQAAIAQFRYQNSMLRQRDSALEQIQDLRANFPAPADNDERTTTNDERLLGDPPNIPHIATNDDERPEGQ